MEGGSGCMVAIVQGLRDAGLAVTLTRRGNATRPHGSLEVLTLAKSSVDTSFQNHAGVQICDDRYTSSYQSAHCNVRPSSPVVQTPEFPRQSPTTSITRGNFEIGDGGRGESPIPDRIKSSPRSIFDSTDRGLPSKGTVAFAHSLRRYPLFPTGSPPGRSPDLIQRLIAYSQAKNFSKGSCHIKTVRSPRNKVKEQKTEEAHIQTKGVQTYTRTQPQSSDKMDADKAQTSRMAPKRLRLSAPRVDSRNIRSKDNELNETYDYLKSTRYYNRVAEVRYLSDVTRCLRDTIQQLCDDTPQICPNIRCRYSRHRREQHADNFEPQESRDSYNITTQASIPMVSKAVPAWSSCEALPGTYVTYTTAPKICCVCNKPIPCVCAGTSIKKVSRSFLDSEQGFAQKIEGQVYEWLNEIPVYVNDKPEDKRKRESLVKDLISKLKCLERDEYYEENAKNEIMECVNSLPMWYPMSKRDQSDFKTQVTDNLLNKIRNVSTDPNKYKEHIVALLDGVSFKSRNSIGDVIDQCTVKDHLVDKLNAFVINAPPDKSMKSEVVDILNEFPIKVEGDKTTYLNNLGAKIADKLQNLSARETVGVSLKDEYIKQISDWLGDIPELSSDSAADIKSYPKLIESLAKNLQSIQSKGIHDVNVQAKMQEEIVDWLRNNTSDRIDEEVGKELSEKLLQKLIKVSHQPHKKKVLDKEELKDETLTWLEDVPELAGSRSENLKTAEEVSSLVQKLQAQGKTEQEIENAVKEWLDNTTEESGNHIDSETKANLAKKLIGNIRNKFSELRTAESTNIFDTSDFYNSSRTSHSSDMLDSSQRSDGSKIHDGNKTSDGKKAFTDKPTDSSRATDDKTNEGSKTHTSKRPSSANRIDSDKKSDNLKEDVTNCLGDILNLNKRENKKFADELQLKLEEMKSRNVTNLSESEIQDEMSNMLKMLSRSTGTNLSPTQRNNLAKKLIALVNTPKQRKRWSKQEDLQTAMADEITHVLDDAALNLDGDSKRKLQNKIQSIISKNIDKIKLGENNEISKQLTEILKQDAKLPHKKAKSIADDLIRSAKDMPSQGELTFAPDMKTALSTEINNTLDDINIDDDKKDELQSTLSNILADQVMRGESDKNTKDRLVAALKRANVSDKESEKIISQLMGKGKEMVQRFKPEHSFKTSTPRGSLDKGSFHARRTSKDPTMSVIFDDSISQEYKKRKTPKEDEIQYLSQLVNKINSWVHGLHFDLNSKDKDSKDTMLRDLAEDIIDRQKYLQVNPNAKTSDNEELEHLRYQVFRWLNKLPSVKQDVQHLMPPIAKAKELMDLIKSVPVPQFIVTSETGMSSDGAPTNLQFRNPTDVFYDNMMSLCDGLPIEGGDTPEEQAKAKELKQNIVSRLMNKMADLNINPEILNDDSFYEGLMQDEISAILLTLPQTPEMQSYLSTLKNNLMEKVKDAKHKIQNELAGHTYKQQLRDTISNTLPSVANIPEEEQIPFEVVKDSLADAFINLNYSAESGELKSKYRNQISDEINKFCNDYLKKFPGTPIDPVKLNEQLYAALQKVPVPKEEPLQAQVEQIRIKDDINDWLKNVPLKEATAAEELQKKKVVSVLAKDLHNIEKEKDSNPNVDADNRMKHDIIKWVKKLPLQPGIENNIEPLANELVAKLKLSKEKRKYNVSHPSSQKSDLSQSAAFSRSRFSAPPSNLNFEDRQHLERIRQRSYASSSLQKSLSQDAAVSPIPIEAGSQTGLGTEGYELEPCMPCNLPISPNVIVNEYNWDNTDVTMTQGVCPGIQPQLSCLQRSYQPQMPQQSVPSELRVPSPIPNQYGSKTDSPYPSMKPSYKPPPQAMRPKPSAPRQPCIPSHSQPPSMLVQSPCMPRTPPCMPPPPPCGAPQPPYTPPPQRMPSQSPCIPPAPPCTPTQPCMPPPPTCMSPNPTCQLPQPCFTPKPPCMQRTSPSPPPPQRPSKKPSSYLNTPDISSASSPFEEYDADQKSTFRSPRVTKLGSFDKPPTRTCGNQSPRAKRSREYPDEDSEWTIRLPDDTEFWGFPCPRRRPYRISVPSADTQVFKERTEQKSKCYCKQQTKCMSRKPRSCSHTRCHATESMRHCSKCCGMQCPYPSYQFFK